MRRSILFVAAALSLAGPATAQNAPDKAPAAKQVDPKEAAKQADIKVRTALNAAGGSIDACTDRYLSEYPAADGKADIALTVLKNGMVQKATVEVGLEGARNLKPCLEAAGRGIKFPDVANDGATLKITVPIKKGAKFRVPMPGDPPPEGAKPQDEGFVQFLPADWTPQQ
jgi:hypothetical protein